MKNLALWLLEMEGKAAEFYRLAAQYFKDDLPLNSFLRQLANEEIEHCQVMRNAVAFFERSELDAPLFVNEEDRARLEASFVKALDLFSREEISKVDLMEAIFQVEFSELNDIFLYIVDCLADQRGESLRSVTEIEQHRRSIVHFFELMPEGRIYFQKMQDTPPVWEEKILVVDDSAPITSLVKAVLKNAGKVHTAANGQEALEKTKEHYYRIIISDVDMPIMDGLDFYQNALNLFPSINNRFLFLTGSLSQEKSSFFSKHNLPFMEKPAAIADIKEKVFAMMDERSGESLLSSQNI